jgi:hypothetical protein
MAVGAPRPTTTSRCRRPDRAGDGKRRDDRDDDARAGTTLDGRRRVAGGRRRGVRERDRQRLRVRRPDPRRRRSRRALAVVRGRGGPSLPAAPHVVVPGRPRHRRPRSSRLSPDERRVPRRHGAPRGHASPVARDLARSDDLRRPRFRGPPRADRCRHLRVRTARRGVRAVLRPRRARVPSPSP